MMLPLVILGSARPNGETRKAVDLAFPQGTAELVLLPDFAIGGYDYGHVNVNDGFGGIAHRMAEAEKIIIPPPLSWYAMSAPLKIFFDRLTDMTENLKKLGKQLAGKPVWVIATGTENTLPDGFEVPFARTAAYFDMRYRGCAYHYTGTDAAKRSESEAGLVRFGEGIIA